MGIHVCVFECSVGIFVALCGNRVVPAQETDPPGMKEFPAKANLADEPIEASRRVEIPVARPRELPPLHLPIVAPKKVPRKWREIKAGGRRNCWTQDGE